MPEKIIGWTLGLLFALMVAVLILGPHVGRLVLTRRASSSWVRPIFSRSSRMK